MCAGLDYPGVGPELAYLRDTGRLDVRTATDDEALSALQESCRLEGILPALETAHALARARDVARELGKGSGCWSTLRPRGQGPASCPRRAGAACARDEDVSEVVADREHRGTAGLEGTAMRRMTRARDHTHGLRASGRSGWSSPRAGWARSTEVMPLDKTQDDGHGWPGRDGGA